jgi:pyruvate,water dikinase
MSDAGTPSEPVAIPPQEDFPVEWASADEEKIPWQLDLMHFNNAMPPLEGEFWAQFIDGVGLGMEHFEMPLQVAAKPFNYWLYYGVFPRFPPEQMEEQSKRSDEVVMATIYRLQERWDDEWLPEIKAQIEEWDAFDVAAASTADLRAHLSEMWEGAHRLADIHFQIIIPVYIALSLLDELYNDLFSDGVFESQKLFQGFDNKTMEVGRALWDLSRKARASGGVRKIFEEHSPGDVLNALAESDDGRAFAKELDDFLNSHGKRMSDWGIRHESWIEDPSPVLVNLKDYIQQEGDPDAELEERAAERIDAITAVRERLQGYPSHVRDEFERLLKAAATAVVLSEDHGYWIDFQSTYRVRRVIVEIGERLAQAGTVAIAADVFFLRTDEITPALGASPAPDHTGVVEARKKEMEHFGSVKPPLFMGTDYGPPPPDLLSTALGKFFGAPAEQDNAADTVAGNAGSPGKFRGTARVVRSLDEADKLGVGEILVAETTSPSWTPLFATAAGIVTDTGGILSHCAVVAREYRIPAVVGTGVATSTIRDGQTIEVDGDAGRVHLID